MIKKTYPICMCIVFFLILIFFKKYPQPVKQIVKPASELKFTNDELRKINLKYELKRKGDNEKYRNMQRMMMDHPDKCYSLQIWSIKADILIKSSCDNTFISEMNNKCGGIVNMQDKKNINEMINNQVNGGGGVNQGKIVEKLHTDKNQASNSVVYVFVIFLVFSLIRALMDISKQLKKVNILYMSIAH